MRILWSSNAPWAKTGYGNQTALFLPRLKALGHEVAAQAWYGLEAGALSWNGIPVYPKAFHGYGQDVLGAHAAHFRADIAITLIDAWVMEPHLYGPRVKWVPWFPIDMTPIPPPVLRKVSDAFQGIVYSRFAETLCRRAGLDVRYIPHGVDTRVLYPEPMAAARERLGWPQDRYIVAMVAANKGTPSRKALPESLAAFAEFRQRVPEALLYLHTNDGHQLGGINLPELVDYLGLKGAVTFADQYSLILGYPDDYMRAVYSGANVLLAASMGEGFGIPILEAQACGCPVVVGDYTSMSELCWRGAAIPESRTAKFWTPLGAYQYLPQVDAIAYALREVWRATYDRASVPTEVAGYDADHVAEHYWRPVLDEIAARLEPQAVAA